MKFDLLTGGQEIKLAILVKFQLFLAVICLFSSYFFASIKTQYFSWDSIPIISHKKCVVPAVYWKFQGGGAQKSQSFKRKVCS